MPNFKSSARRGAARKESKAPLSGARLPAGGRGKAPRKEDADEHIYGEVCRSLWPRAVGAASQAGRLVLRRR